MRRLLTCLGVAVIVCLGVGFYLKPRTLRSRIPPPIPAPALSKNSPALAIPGGSLVVRIAAYDDEVFAYLMFQHFRNRAALKHREVFLTYRSSGGTYQYEVQANLGNDLLTLPYILEELASSGPESPSRARFVPSNAVDTFRYQTRHLATAYGLNGARPLESLTEAELLNYLKRFVRFKSATDPRIRRKIEPIPQALNAEQAAAMAADIVAVAGFYSLPLYVFLGIGAIENNYMSVPGDLEHSVWKRRLEPGDIVLKVRRGRYLVLNSSAGVWQITRETLRRAHRLYFADKRDYSLLPAHLRPPPELHLDRVRQPVLTTYAGILVRDLIDQCNGVLNTAVGAYNGGIRAPNMRYAAGVQQAAEFARTYVKGAAALRGRPAAGMHFLRASPRG